MDMRERIERAIEHQVDTRLAHMTGREMVEDGTIFRGIADAVLAVLHVTDKGAREDMAQRLRAAVKDCSGYEPSISVLARAADEAADMLDAASKKEG